MEASAPGDLRCGRYRDGDKQGGGLGGGTRPAVFKWKTIRTSCPPSHQMKSHGKGGNGTLDVVRSDVCSRCYRRTCTRAAFRSCKQPGGAATEEGKRAPHVLASAIAGPPPSLCAWGRRWRRKGVGGGHIPGQTCCPLLSSADLTLH